MSVAYIGMGGNLAGARGTPEQMLAGAVVRIGALLGRVTGRSSLYSTEPVGYADQPRFLNAVVAVETELGPRELLEGLLGIEQEFGRDRSAGIQNGPRTLDLDVLLYGDWVVSEAGLEIPHPRLAERAFVLVPLSEIAAAVCDPRTGQSVGQLMESLKPDPQGINNGIFKVESDVWRACADGTGAGVGA